MTDGALGAAAGLLLASLGLGVAGLDPTGALLAVAALAAGARPRAVLLFGALVLVLTAVLGTVLSLTAGASLAGVDWASSLPGGPLTAALEAVAGAVALVWAAARLRRGAAGSAREEAAVASGRRSGARLASGAGMAGAAVLFTAGAVLDPSFLGVVVLAGRAEPLPAVLAAHLVWSVVSQAPLVLLLVAVARGGHERATALFTRWWARARPVVRHAVTAALVLLGLGLLLDAGWYAATGRFLVLDPGA